MGRSQVLLAGTSGHQFYSVSKAVHCRELATACEELKAGLAGAEAGQRAAEREAAQVLQPSCRIALCSRTVLPGQGRSHLGGRQPEEGGGVGGQGGGEQQHVGAAQARPPAGEGEGEGGKYRKLCDC